MNKQVVVRKAPKPNPKKVKPKVAGSLMPTKYWTQTQMNPLYSAQMSLTDLTSTPKPSFTNGPASVKVSHSEMITSVWMTNGFQCNSWIINPGRSMFPWLSGWATAFDKWSIITMRVRYVPRTSTFSNGNVYIGYDYDVMDEPPSSEIALTQTCGIVSTTAYVSGYVNYEVSRAPAKEMFTLLRNSPEDRWSDGGQLLVATSGSSGFYAGTIWVDYVIELKIPQAFDPCGIALAGYNIADPTASHPGPAVEEVLWPTVSGARSFIPSDALFSGQGLKRYSTALNALMTDLGFTGGDPPVMRIDMKGTSDTAIVTATDMAHVVTPGVVNSSISSFTLLDEAVDVADDGLSMSASAQYQINPSIGTQYLAWTLNWVATLAAQLATAVISITLLRAPKLEL
jgi:hypothetical protein